MSICVMADVAGTELTAADIEFLNQPEIAGVILFSRNYQNPTQLKSLCSQLKSIRSELLIAVDQEGGRVQRFREGFLRLPAMSVLGDLYRSDTKKAGEKSHALGWLMAHELIQCGVDISFAPVLDVDFGHSSVIGDRAFASDPQQVTILTRAFIEGMNQAGMQATAKHFPGHGYVTGDSHKALPVDGRSLSELEEFDLQPFKQLIDEHKLAAVMPAHVIYSQVDYKHTAGFSKHWLQTILRHQLGFEGVIFSDDLSMQGAVASGSPAVRALKAKQAGCNVLLICNQRGSAQEIVDTVRAAEWPLMSLQSMRACPAPQDEVGILYPAYHQQVQDLLGSGA